MSISGLFVTACYFIIKLGRSECFFFGDINKQAQFRESTRYIQDYTSSPQLSLSSWIVFTVQYMDSLISYELVFL